MQQKKTIKEFGQTSNEQTISHLTASESDSIVTWEVMKNSIKKGDEKTWLIKQILKM